MSDDPAVDALRALVATLKANNDRIDYVVNRAEAIERLRAQDYTWRQILATEERPLITDIISQNMILLNEVIGRLRREEARCLLAEGAKRQEIADLFGVTLEHVDAMIPPDA